MPYFQCFYKLAILSSLLVSCGNNAQDSAVSPYAMEIHLQRAAKNERMVSDRVIEQNNAADFKGLKYYEPDSIYRIKAEIEWLNGDSVVFQTNSERSPVYFKLFAVTFKIADSACRLTVYSEDRDGKTGLFIPFRDKTNTSETYGGGRYIEMPYSGEKEYLVIDFNKAFNPYCHYNHGYSCPVVPVENVLHVPIPAGEKKLYD